MKRPLCTTLLFYLTGILFGRYLYNIGIVLFLLIITSVVITAVLFYEFKQYFILFFPLASVLGFVLYTTQINSNSHILDYINNNNIKQVEITGVVTDISLSKSGRQKIVIDVTKIDFGKEIKYYSFLNIYAILAEDESVQPGQAISATGEILPFDDMRNPGSYHEFQHLRSNWNHFKMFPDITEKGGLRRSIRTVLLDMRIRASDVIDSVLPAKESGILKAIILGDTSGLSDEIEELYSDSGIYHVLAVSGLHIAIISQMLNYIMTKMKIREQKSCIITLLFLIFYCIFTGAGAATLRATIMCSIATIGRLLLRDTDNVTTVSFAAFCILLYSPMFLFNFGFIYSFTAVYGFIFGDAVFDKFRLYLISKTNNAFLHKMLATNYWKKNVASTLIAALVTYPLTVYFFYKIPLMGIVINLLIIPSVIVIVAFGFITVILGFISVWLAAFQSAIIFFMLNIYELICRVALSLPFSLILVGRPHIAFVIGFYVILILIAYYCNINFKNAKSKRMLKLKIKICIALYAMSIIIFMVLPKPLNITMLDVSQGDCVVVNKGSMTFVVDGGGLPFREIGKNTGKTVLKPYLDYLGAESITAAFATHADSDHALGIIEIMQLKKVERLILPEAIKNDPDNEIYIMLLETALLQNIEVYYIKAGDEISFNAGFNEVKIVCLYPYEGTIGYGNDASLVFKIIYGDIEMLMTGDIGWKEEEKLLEENPKTLKSDILKVAHHGSKYSSDAAFIEATSPTVAIIGVGRNNLYGHPTPEVIEILERNNAKIYTTAGNGAIMIKTTGERFSINTMIEQAKKQAKE